MSDDGGDPLDVVTEYWREKVHERDLRETKWPRDPASVTARWLSAQLGREVEDFHFVEVGSAETTRSIRLKVHFRATVNATEQHQHQHGDQTRGGSIALDFPSDNPAVRRLWGRAYRNAVTFQREFAARTPVAAALVAANYDPQQPFQFCVVAEDTLADDNFLDFPDWAAKGMNTHFAQMMYTSVARSHGAFFANPAVEKQLRTGGGIGLRPDGRYAPAFAHVLGAFFEPSAAGAGLVAGDRFRELPLRDVYKALVPRDRQDPVPALFGPRGREIVERCLDVFHRRPLTLCHGELHPGHAHMDVATNEFRFAGAWRLVSAAPPGSDLAVGMLTALQPCTRAQMRGVVNTYYAALVTAGADGAAYSADDCWEDFLIGCVLWCCTYPTMEIEGLAAAAAAAGAATAAAAEAPLGSYLPAVHARMLRHAAELDLQGFALGLLPGGGQAAASATGAKRSSKPRAPVVIRPAPQQEPRPEQAEQRLKPTVSVPFT